MNRIIVRIIHVLLIEICFVTFARGQLVQLKFWLKNKSDSTFILPENVILKPRISHRAYHNNQENHNLLYAKTANVRYDSSDRSYIFSYDKKYYHYQDIFLEVESQDLYYRREWESDYDEEDCLNLTKVPNSTFFLSSYRYLLIKQGSLKLSHSDCLHITLKQVTPLGDTIICSPFKRHTEDTLRLPTYFRGKYLGLGTVTTSSSSCYFNEQMILRFEEHYLLEVAIYNGLDSHYAYYDLPSKLNPKCSLLLDQIPFFLSTMDEPIGNCDHDARGANCFSEKEVESIWKQSEKE
jgi:hypothetical protein